MTDRPDDLARWDDDDLVRALRAPGTPTELADQEQYVAAFREARGSTVRSLPRRAAGRLGAGGTAVVVTVALTSGVAAAFTGRLPDPVQQVAHTVIGAPPPDTRHHVAAADSRRHGASPSGHQDTTPSTSSPTSGPSASTTPDDQGQRGTSPTSGHDSSPSPSPSTGTTSPPTSSSGGSASAMTMSAAAHRVDLGQTLTLTGLVTDDTGAPLPGQPVALQVRGPRHWRQVVRTTSDDAGLAAATTPPVTRTTRFRWQVARGVASTPWRVAMVPALSLSADVGGTRTTLALTTQGAGGGDRFQVFRHLNGQTTMVSRARLDASGTATLSVVTPRRRATYAVRLLPAKRHAGARTRVLVLPPAPAHLTIAGSASRVGAGGAAAIGGTVTSAAGDALPGRRVVLLRSGPRGWRPVGHAVTDAAGHVSIATPAIALTSRFRLRTLHHVSSGVWRVVEVPTVTASAKRSSTTVTVSATTRGARPGDRALLLRRGHGRLVLVGHARLGAGGSVAFVTKPRATRTTYVVRLVGTRKHAPASGSVSVPGA
jgi:hypothetical protein